MCQRALYKAVAAYSGLLPPDSGRLPPYSGRLPPYPGPHFHLHISTKTRSGAAFERGIGSSITSLLLLLLLREHTHSTQRTEGIRTMPCAAGELCLVPARTPERPDGLWCEANPDCDNPMQRVCHDYPAAKRSSKGKGKAVKPQAGKRRASDTGGVGAGPWKNAKSGTDNTDKKHDKRAPCTRLSNAQKVEILGLLDRKVSHLVVADRYGCGPRTVLRIAENRVSITKLVASASTKASSCKSNRSAGFPEVRKQVPKSYVQYVPRTFFSYMYLNAVCILNNSNVSCSLDDSVQQLLVGGL